MMESNVELFAATLARAFGELPLSERMLAIVEKVSRHPGHSLSEEDKAGYFAEFPSDYGVSR